MKRWLWIPMLSCLLLISGCAAKYVTYNRAQDLYNEMVLGATTRAHSQIRGFYQDRPTAQQEAIGIIDQWENAARQIVNIYDDSLRQASNNRVRQMIDDKLSSSLIKTFSEINSAYRSKLKDQARADALIILDEWRKEAYTAKDPGRFNAMVEQLAKRMTGQNHWSYQEAAETNIRFRNNISH